MEIGVTGDLHIKVPPDNVTWYTQRFQKLVEALQFDLLIITGDVFDKSPSFLDVALFSYLINNVKQVIIIEGNHDYNRKTRFLKLVSNISAFENCKFVEDIDTLKINGVLFTFVSNKYIRQGKKIPSNKGILVSHIACELPQYDKKAEYDLESLTSYDLIFLGDIHTYFKYSDRIYYTSSPYRTFKKTIYDLNEVDNSFFGFLKYDFNRVEKVELNLPNEYNWVQYDTYNKPPDDGNLYHVEIVTSHDRARDFLDEDVAIEIRKKSDITIGDEDFKTVVEKAIKEFYSTEPQKYIDEIERLGLL